MEFEGEMRAEGGAPSVWGNGGRSSRVRERGVMMGEEWIRIGRSSIGRI